MLQVGTLLVAIAASTALAAWWAGRQSLQALSRDEGKRLQLHALSLQRLVDRYRVLPSTLALDTQLQTALETPRGEINVDALNRKLERTNGATHVSTLTLIGRHGVAIAASNWRTATSNVGRDYDFRPYFQLAMRKGEGTFYAIGVTTHVPGYFIAQAIKGQGGERIGVIVVKITLQQIREEWAGNDDTIALSDKHGIVFLSNDPRWQYRPLHHLSDAVIAQVARTRQYADRLRAPVQLHAQRHLDDGGRVVQVGLADTSTRMLERSRALPAQGWTIHSFSSMRPVTTDMRNAALVTLGGWLPVILLGLYLRQRTRLARMRQRSREELERLVAHYASALRSEQDSFVQAATQAIAGSPERLEALPQGVSVVDADLRLVAWNRHYAEVFDYPQDLLTAGRPIEDLLRYNARGGLLGAGDTEAAIARRLHYLRQGKPHMYEREHADGSVLEIRGNPLPGGGFVTSYANITRYKKAARALRTLTDTLEHRIEKRTGQLRAAKAEAEHANRNKTRHVAAAVHDLLQPLNAARLFCGRLHRALHQPDEHAMLERVEQALHALDRQLGSMLDLSRLEAGAIEPHIEDVALAPMLQRLAREFDIIAQAQGLSLHLVNTNAWVRTDVMLLRRVLQNFLSNAVHYTPHGRILIGCRRHGDMLRVEVWDTGIGVPADKRETIFHEFTRLGAGRGTNVRSAGLGLSIVQRIAAQLGHPLVVRSREGHGSMFGVEVLRVPKPQVAPVATPIAHGRDTLDSPLVGRRVLCIGSGDDGTILRELLRRWSCQPLVARSVADIDTRTREHIDLVLIEAGRDASVTLACVKRVRNQLAGQPPCIVLTAREDTTTRQHLREAGLHTLTRPVSPARLRALMRQLLTAADAV
ncbi:MAG TPA: PAS-domain containing protein [Oleiagrimonas sp.]|nr:PAS-domain containing protein [Oleiagrimonas sp.]